MREVANDFERNPHNPTMARHAPHLYLPMIHVPNRPHLQIPQNPNPDPVPFHSTYSPYKRAKNSPQDPDCMDHHQAPNVILCAEGCSSTDNEDEHPRHVLTESRCARYCDEVTPQVSHLSSHSKFLMRAATKPRLGSATLKLEQPYTLNLQLWCHVPRSAPHNMSAT